jgi:hypothetical protein
MAKAKAKTKKSVQSQAMRILEAAKKSGADRGGQNFARTMGKATLAKQGRKPTKMG